MLGKGQFGAMRALGLLQLVLGFVLWALVMCIAASERDIPLDDVSNRRTLQGSGARQGRRFNFKGDTWIANGQVKRPKECMICLIAWAVEQAGLLEGGISVLLLHGTLLFTRLSVTLILIGRKL